MGTSDNMNYFNINITWEDALKDNEDYHDLGLFGYYSTDYCNIVQGNGILVISSNNGKRITIVG